MQQLADNTPITGPYNTMQKNLGFAQQCKCFWLKETDCGIICI